MKQTILFASLMLAALSFVSCKKSEPTDLRLMDLQGNVESVQTNKTFNVRADGKKTRKSFNLSGATYYFNQEGVMISAEDGWKMTISRDASGNIDTLSIPCQDADGGWNDGGYNLSYKWNENNYPIEVDFSNCIGTYSSYSIIYDDSCKMTGKVEYCAEEGDEWEVYYKYQTLSVDEHGNWISRLEFVNSTQDRNVEINLEERTITYFEETSPK